jgi:hypothetical protein
MKKGHLVNAGKTNPIKPNFKPHLFSWPGAPEDAIIFPSEFIITKSCLYWDQSRPTIIIANSFPEDVIIRYEDYNSVNIHDRWQTEVFLDNRFVGSGIGVIINGRVS